MGVLAHVDSGKTTLSEGLLYLSGALRKLGRVDHQDSFLDTDTQERERGITIFSKQAEFSYGGTAFTLLDTPGHVDFSAEMERSLQVLDCAVLVVSGTDGIQGHTRTLWKLLDKHKIPTFLFINKMDLAGSDRDALLAQLQAAAQLHRHLVALIRRQAGRQRQQRVTGAVADGDAVADLDEVGQMGADMEDVLPPSMIYLVGQQLDIYGL